MAGAPVKRVEVLSFAVEGPVQSVVEGLDLSSGLPGPLLDQLRAKLPPGAIPRRGGAARGAGGAYLADENSRSIEHELDGSDAARRRLAGLTCINVFGRAPPAPAPAPLSPAAPAAPAAGSPSASGSAPGPAASSAGASSGAGPAASSNSLEWSEVIDISPATDLIKNVRCEGSFYGAFGELLDNALQACKENREQGREVLVRVHIDADRQVLTIEDNGKGLSFPEAKRIGKLGDSMNAKAAVQRGLPRIAPPKTYRPTLEDIASHLMTSNYSRFGSGMKRAGFYIGDDIDIAAYAAGENVVIKLQLRFTRLLAGGPEGAGAWEAVATRRQATREDVARGPFFRIQVSKWTEDFKNKYAREGFDSVLCHMGEKYTFAIAGGIGSCELPQAQLIFSETREQRRSPDVNLHDVFFEVLARYISKADGNVPAWAETIESWRMYATMADGLQSALLLPVFVQGDSLLGVLALKYFPRTRGRNTIPDWDRLSRPRATQQQEDSESGQAESRVLAVWNGLLLRRSPVNKYTRDLQNVLPFMVPPPRLRAGRGPATRRRDEAVTGTPVPYRCFAHRVAGFFFLNENTAVNPTKTEVDPDSPLLTDVMASSPDKAHHKQLWGLYCEWLLKRHQEEDKEVYCDFKKAVVVGEGPAVEAAAVKYVDVEYRAGEMVKFQENAEDDEGDDADEGGPGSQGAGPSALATQAAAAGAAASSSASAAATPQSGKKRKGKGRVGDASPGPGPGPGPSSATKGAAAARTKAPFSVGKVLKFKFSDTISMEGTVEIEPLQDEEWPELGEGRVVVEKAIECLRGKAAEKDVAEARGRIRQLAPSRIDLAGESALPGDREVQTNRAIDIACRFLDGREAPQPVKLGRLALGVCVAVYVAKAAVAGTDRESQEAPFDGAELEERARAALKKRPKMQLVFAAAAAGRNSHSADASGASTFYFKFTPVIDTEHLMVAWALKPVRGGGAWALDNRIARLERPIRVAPGAIDEIEARWAGAGEPTLPFGVVAPPLLLHADDDCGNVLRGDWRGQVPPMTVTCASNTRHFKVRMLGESLAVRAEEGRLLASGLWLVPCDGAPHAGLRSGSDPTAAAELQVSIAFGEPGPGKRVPKMVEANMRLRCRVTAGPPAGFERQPAEAGGHLDEAVLCHDGERFPPVKLLPRDRFGYRSTAACEGYRVQFDLAQAGGLLEGPADVSGGLQASGRSVTVEPPFVVRGENGAPAPPCAPPAPPFVTPIFVGAVGALLLRPVGGLPEALRHAGLAPDAAQAPAPTSLPFIVSYLMLRCSYASRAAREAPNRLEDGPPLAGDAERQPVMRLGADESASVAGIFVEAVKELNEVHAGYGAGTRLTYARAAGDGGGGGADDEDVVLVDAVEGDISSPSFVRGVAKLPALEMPGAPGRLQAPLCLRYTLAIVSAKQLHTVFDIIWIPATPVQAEAVAEAEPLRVQPGETCRFGVRVLAAGGEPVRGRAVELALRASGDLSGLDASRCPGFQPARGGAGPPGARLALRTDEGGVARVEGLLVAGEPGAAGGIEVEVSAAAFGRDGEGYAAELDPVCVPCRIATGVPERLELEKAELKLQYGRPLGLRLLLRDAEGRVADFGGPARVRVEEYTRKRRRDGGAVSHVEETVGPFPAGQPPVEQVDFADGAADYTGPPVPRPHQSRVYIRDARLRVTVTGPGGAWSLSAVCMATLHGDAGVFALAACLREEDPEPGPEPESRRLLPLTERDPINCLAGQPFPRLSFKLLNELMTEWRRPAETAVMLYLWSPRHGGDADPVELPAPQRRAPGPEDREPFDLYSTPEGLAAPRRAGVYRLFVCPEGEAPAEYKTGPQVFVKHGAPFAVRLIRAGGPAAPSGPGDALPPIHVALCDEHDNVCDGPDAPEAAPLQRGRARFDNVAIAGEGRSGQYRLRFVLQGAGLEGATPLPDHASSSLTVFFRSPQESAAADAHAKVLIEDLQRLSREKADAEAKLKQFKRERDKLEEQLAKVVRREMPRVRGLAKYPTAHSDPNYPFQTAIDAERAALDAARGGRLREAVLFPQGRPRSQAAQRLLADSRRGAVPGFLGFLGEMGRVEDDADAEAIARFVGRSMQGAVFRSQDDVDLARQKYPGMGLRAIGVESLADRDVFRGGVRAGDAQGRLELPGPPIPHDIRGRHMVNLIHLSEGAVAEGHRRTVWWCTLKDAILFDSFEHLQNYRRRVLNNKLSTTLVAMVRDAEGRLSGIRVQRSGWEEDPEEEAARPAPAVFAGVPVHERPQTREAEERIAALTQMQRLRAQERELEGRLAERRGAEQAERGRLEGLRAEAARRQAELEAAQGPGGAGDGEGGRKRRSGARPVANVDGGGGGAGPSNPKRPRGSAGGAL
eukprot:tig00000788_g4064.t1